MLNIFCPGLALYSYHHPSKVIINIEEVSKKYKILTLRICKLNKHRRTDISFLIPVREIVLGESLVCVVDKRAHVLFVCWVLTVAFNPHSLILERMEYKL